MGLHSETFLRLDWWEYRMGWKHFGNGKTSWQDFLRNSFFRTQLRKLEIRIVFILKRKKMMEKEKIIFVFSWQLTDRTIKLYFLITISLSHKKVLVVVASLQTTRV